MMGIAALNPSCGLARRFLENAGNQDVQSASGRNARIAPDFLNRATLLTNRATICSNRATNWRDSSIRSGGDHGTEARSAEHTSELQSLMRNSYAVFGLKK